MNGFRVDGRVFCVLRTEAEKPKSTAAKAATGPFLLCRLIFYEQTDRKVKMKKEWVEESWAKDRKRRRGGATQSR